MKKKVKSGMSQNKLKKILEQKENEIHKLQEQLNHKVNEIYKISTISQSVVQKLGDVDEILTTIVKITAELLKTKICSIMLVDEQKQELIIKATQSLDEEYKNKPNIKIGQSISGLAVKEFRPITVLDVTKDSRYAFPDIAKKMGLVSMLAVPMFFQNKVIGVLNVYTSEQHEFTSLEINILQTIANQSAVALGTSSLINEITKTKEELETRKLVERAKGIIMKIKGMTEEDAHRFLQKKSMDSKKPLKEIASAIILAYEIEK
ncbi:MAG: GAF domain-containing protein [Endomicrobiia bacterium]